jgi:hypothetical protein
VTKKVVGVFVRFSCAASGTFGQVLRTVGCQLLVGRMQRRKRIFGFRTVSGVSEADGGHIWPNSPAAATVDDEVKWP